MLKRFGQLVTVLVAAGVFAAGMACAQMPPEEGTRVAQMPAVSPHWILLSSPFQGSLEVSNVTILDADSLKVLGMLTGGLVSTVTISPDRKQIYMADTFYSRGSRGDRTDVVTIYDTKNLQPSGEIAIPPKRQLYLPDPTSLATTSDGKLLLIANLTPATSVTVADIAAKKVVGEIEIPGCTEILPTGPLEFTSLCGDGAMLTVDFDDQGKSISQKRTAAPFFNPEKDPVFGMPAVIGKKAYFISYHGMIYPVDRSTSPATALKPWSVVTGAEKAQGWRPGGWQPLWGHDKRGLLFVLMHQGGEWSHKQVGPEVWVFNAEQGKRADRIALPRPANSIYVSPDDNPVLIAVATGELGNPGTQPPEMQVFSALHGRYLGTVKQLYGFPSMVVGF